jgi:glycosyltransferase involved in cell wall biosynthesis
MAARLQQQYGIEPSVLYNVFPLAHRQQMLPPEQRPRRDVLRLHWVGQSAGPGKGLEEAVEAAALAGGGVELWVRGAPSGDSHAQLERMARDKNVPLRLLPQVHHDDLVGTMAEFDVGLALERLTSANYSITVTNKFFLYMLAGLAVVATDTPGQREVMAQAASAGFVYPCGRPDLLAAQLRRWRDDRAELRAAQLAAWHAAQQRFCWDVEQARFLELLERPRVQQAKSSAC